MLDRRVLELFDQQADFYEETVSAGIEKNRKGDLTVRVVDKSGKPVAGATLKATQISHEFRFGANLFMLDELESDEKNEKYRQHFADVFNIATIPFYWNTLEPERGKPRYDKDSPKVYRRPATGLCMEFCQKHGIEPREHGLAYEAFFPEWLYGASIEETKRELERRYGEIAQRYADQIPTIEVTNEMTWKEGKTQFYDAPEYVQWCFKLAEKYFPNNQLCINECTPVVWGDAGRATDRYYAYIEANMLKGARIDAIGMQYHIFADEEYVYEKTRSTLNPKTLYRHMDLYANFGKPLQITEITIPAYAWEPEKEAIQAEILEKLYSLWFSHPNVEQIIYWNLIDGYAFVPDPDPEKVKASQGDMTMGENSLYGGLLRFDLSPKPAYYKLKELIQQRWHTETEVVTDENGYATFRGFYGDYQMQTGNTAATVCHKKGKDTVHTITV